MKLIPFISLILSLVSLRFTINTLIKLRKIRKEFDNARDLLVFHNKRIEEFHIDDTKKEEKK